MPEESKIGTPVATAVKVDDWLYVCELTPEQREELKGLIKDAVFSLMLRNLHDWSTPRDTRSVILRTCFPEDRV